MVQPLATLLVTWAAIYAYVSGYYVMLHVRRPTHREYFAFGLLCFGLAAWAAGAAIAADASDLADATLGLRIQYVGGFTTVAYFVSFASLLVDRRTPRVRLAAFAWCGIAILVDAAGWLFDPDRRAPTGSWGLSFAPETLEPELTSIGRLLVLGATAFSAWATWVIAQGTQKQRDLRPLVWATGVAVAAATHDTLIRVVGLRSFHLLEHAALLPILTVSFVLLGRFVRAADELGERTQQLRQSYSELRLVQEELVRKEQLAAVGELSAVIAHEVRNPLAIIKNAVSSLRRPTLRPDDRGVLLGILDEEVDRLNRLVRDLLAYARPVEPKGRTVDLAAVIDDAVQAALAHHERPESIALVLETGSVAPVHGDPDLLRQALTNVADNALQAMPQGGTLRVTAAAVRGRAPGVVVTFEDDGSGMDEAVRAKATAPFFTTRPAGTGLGLAIVESVVRNHGGSLGIASEPGRGTVVTVTLPRVRPSSVPPPPEDL